MSEPSSPGSGPVEPATPRGDDELLAADRRTMTIAIVAVVALVLVGITSAALFSPSPCRVIAPTAVEPGPVGNDVAAVVSGALAALSPETQTTVVDGLADVAADLGAVVGAADVRGAEMLTWSDDGPVALGPVTTVLASGGATVRAAADTSGSTVVGDGATLYALALTNVVTGQVDALQPLDAAEDLRGLTCQDTATVGTPLAFLLDAGDGQLLLLRIDEDGDDPDLELRDPVAGRVWGARFDAGAAPAGTVAARLGARLGDDLVVSARRSVPDDEGDVVTAVQRTDGVERWTVTREVLPDGLEAETVALEVLSVGGDQVLLTAAVEREEAGGPVLEPPVLFALDPATGLPMGTPQAIPGPVVAVTSATTDDEVAVHWQADAGTSTGLGGGLEVVRDAEVVASTEVAEVARAVATLGDGTVVAAVGTALVSFVAEGDGLRSEPLDLGVEVADVVARDGRVALLLRDPAGGAVVVTFER